MEPEPEPGRPGSDWNQNLGYKSVLSQARGLYTGLYYSLTVL